MGNQVNTADTDSLRYLEANAVDCPTGKLEGLHVVSQDDEALGVVNGVLDRSCFSKAPILCG